MIIQNSDLKKKLSEDIHATNPSSVPGMMADYQVPVILVNDGVYYAEDPIVKNLVLSNATATTIFTTDSIKDTYITGVTLSVIKDATATSTLSDVRVTIDGAVLKLVGIPGLTLTAQSETINAIFNPPIKVDRSSVVTLANSTATGNVTSVATVTGFLRRRS